MPSPPLFPYTTLFRSFGLTEAEVTAVVSFYTMYKRRPVGDYHVGVCTNTLCAIMGGDQIFAELKDHLGVGNDETTPDGKVQLDRKSTRLNSSHLGISYAFASTLSLHDALPIFRADRGRSHRGGELLHHVQAPPGR